MDIKEKRKCRYTTIMVKKDLKEKMDILMNIVDGDIKGKKTYTNLIKYLINKEIK